MYLFFLSSSCVPYVASFSGLSIFHCPFAASVFSNVYFITRFTGQIVLSLLSHGRLRGDGCLLLTNSLIHVPLTGVCDPVLDSSVEVARPWHGIFYESVPYDYPCFSQALSLVVATKLENY